jgi:hypothetical protein
MPVGRVQVYPDAISHSKGARNRHHSGYGLPTCRDLQDTSAIFKDRATAGRPAITNMIPTNER